MIYFLFAQWDHEITVKHLGKGKILVIFHQTPETNQNISYSVLGTFIIYTCSKFIVSPSKETLESRWTCNQEYNHSPVCLIIWDYKAQILHYNKQTKLFFSLFKLRTYILWTLSTTHWTTSTDGSYCLILCYKYLLIAGREVHSFTST